MTALIGLATGLGVTVLVLLVWLGGIAYLRRSREAMEAAAPRRDMLAGTTPDSVPDVSPDTADEPASIEEWIARAEALPEGRQPHLSADGERDQTRLQALAAKHFPHLTVPAHVHLFGLTGVEKRLLAWVSAHTGMPDPFVALDRVTGDPDALRRATDAWHDAHADLTAAIDVLCVATDHLHAQWTGPAAERFYTPLAEYLAELDALAADLKTTEDALRGLQAEAALVESTIAGLVNLLVGSLTGYVVEAVLSAGTMTPAVAAQAQIELSWVLKQIARALGRLQSIYANVHHVLQSVHGFRHLERVRDRFRVDELATIVRSLDPARAF